jgi:hypothetical protein
VISDMGFTTLCCVAVYWCHSLNGSSGDGGVHMKSIQYVLVE